MPADGDTSGGAAGAGAAPNAPPPPASAPGPSTTAAPADPPPLTDTALLASFFAEVRSADRDAEVDRVLGAFKLNPYEQVGCRFDATDAEVTRAYRKVRERRGERERDREREGGRARTETEMGGREVVRRSG